MHLRAFSAFVFIVPLLLAAQQPASQPSQATPPAQNSIFTSGLTSPKLDIVRKQYFDFKRAFIQQGAANLPSDKDASAMKDYDLILCDGAKAASGNLKIQASASEAVELAYRVAIWKHDFPLLGYSSDTWQPALASFEDSSLKDIISGYAGGGNSASSPEGEHNYELRLLRDLNASRKLSGRKLPEIIADGGCGGGEEGIQIKLKPSSGTVFFQTMFFRKVCQAQHVDPDDMNKCGHWYEAFENKLTFLAGDYFYRARWNDGVVRTGTFRIRSEDDGEPITLTKP